MRIHWGKIVVTLTGLALLLLAGLVLARTSAAGMWGVAALAALGVLLGAAHSASSVGRAARPVRIARK